MEQFTDRALLKILPRVTALQSLAHLETHLGLKPNSLLIKRDDELFDGIGGNKARKLEFVLGDFKQRKINQLVTFGAWGSNHVMITALCAQKYGFQLKAYLSPQPMTLDVQNKLKALKTLNVSLKFVRNSLLLAIQILRNKKQAGYIHPGASSPLGSLGYVKAANELAEQLKSSQFAGKKINIFLPAGSLGTVAGLLVGFAKLGLSKNIRITAVQVVPIHWNLGRFGILRLTHKVLKLIEPNFEERKKLQKEIKAMLTWKAFDYRPGYGIANPEVQQTIQLMESIEKIPLDVTYAGKAMHAMLRQIKRDSVDDNEVFLFWNTYPKLNLT